MRARFLVYLAASTVWAASPTAQQVLDRYVKALGGSDAIHRHKSSTTRGRFQIPDQHANVEMVTFAMPFKRLVKFRLPQEQEVVSGYDGKIAWRIDPDGKAHLAPDDELPSERRDADFYYPTTILTYFKSFKNVGVIKFEGRPCYHLTGINNWGKQNEHFYDRKTGLLAGYRFPSNKPGWTTLVFEDYKEFDGVLVPTKLTWKGPDGLQIQTIESVTYDDVDESVFALPEAVKALIQK